MLTSLVKSVVASLCRGSNQNEMFAVKPYLQFGSNSDELTLLWFSAISRRYWTAEYRISSNSSWKAVDVKAGKKKKAKLNGLSVRKFSVALPMNSNAVNRSELAEDPQYRILIDGVPVFGSSFRVPQISDQSKVVVFGDFGDGNQAASEVAAAVHERKPEMIVLAGDLVYDHGRISEYLKYFFPVLNADAIHKDIGAPILRSILTVAAAGNHDVGMPKQSDRLDDKLFTDLFGYFLFWQGTSNGPRLKREIIKAMIGKRKKANQLLADYGKSFLQQTNFTFDWKDQHWIILDANKYADWSYPEMQEWLAKDLEAARLQKWKFVVFHQPGFNSDKKYFQEQRMRLICPILEAGQVDIVFNGHCHFYERHRPLYYRPDHKEPLTNGTVPGEFVIDHEFDGVVNTRPKGILYVVTGASGKLVSLEAKPNEGTLCASSAVLIDQEHSFTELTFAESYLCLNQLGLDGSVLDSVRIDKP